MFGALGTICGLTGSKFGAYLGNPWVVVPAGAVLRGDGPLDVRRLRGRAAVGPAAAPVARRRPRLRGRVPDGPGRRHHRRALHGAAAARAAGLRGHDARRGVGVRHCSRPTARASACRCGCWRRSRCRCRGPAPGWTGSRASSASCCSWPRSTTSRTWSRRSRASRRPRPASRSRWRRWSSRASRWARFTRRFHGGALRARAQGSAASAW